MLVTLPHKFQPRDYQKELLKPFFRDKKRHNFWLIHRRAGKDKTCVNAITAAAFERVGTYLYLFPEHKQARKVIWRGIDGQGMRFMDHIPPNLIKRINNIDMTVDLINGSIIQYSGSNNFNSLMGTNPVGIIYSEFPLHNPLSRQYLSPILAENGGWEILQGTPRGKNHAHKIYLNSLGREEWNTVRLTVDDTKREDGSPIITPEMIEQERMNGMSDEMIEQEFYCSFDIGNTGAYFTKEMNLAEKEGRICLFEVTKDPVWTFWDLGTRDAQAIWFMQPSRKDNLLNMIYYYEYNGVGVEHYIEKLEEVRQRFGFTYAGHYAPHDIKTREWSSARTRIMTAREKGIHFLITPYHSIDDRIQATRTILKETRFHSEYCYQGILSMREFMRVWNDIDKVFKDTPKHNWASHGADAFGYFAIDWRELFKHPGMNAPRVYQSSF